MTLQGGLIQGDGIVDGNVTQTGGSIQPGVSLGILTIDGDYTANGGELLIEIAGPPTDDECNDLAGVTYDRLHVTGDALLGGHLQVEVIGAYGLQRDDVYDIITVNGLDGGFTSTNADDVGTSVLIGTEVVQLDFTDDEFGWSFGDFAVANRDIDGDGRLDYTATAFVQNTIQFGQSLINGIDLPDYLRDLLGQFGPDRAPRRADPLERPRGMLPEQIEETPDAVQARSSNSESRSSRC